MCKELKKETIDSVSIAFDIPEELKSDYSFTQGQNITIRKSFNGEEIRRSYSICSSPLDGELRVGIKKVEKGLFSTFACEELKVGETLEVMNPTGHFYTEIKEGQKKNYLAFAAGSGITPILSIIKTTLAVEKESNFTLVYGNKTTSSIMFLEEIEALKNRFLNRFTVHYILSQEVVDVPLLNGRIDNEKCKALNSNNLINIKDVNEVFLCGPETMIMSVKDTLIELGLDSKHIHFELFTTPVLANTESHQTKTPEEAVVDRSGLSAVSVKIDGLTYQLDLPYNGDSILDAALKTGADLPFACKGGVCCTCRAKVTKGTVSMDMNFSLEDDEVENGYVLTCQSHPTSEEVFVDFDIK
ncbi:MAG: 1,2-phenylacetyl-CoA epoxidase subunit PaaE [Bacteroidia bacterium]